MLRRLFILLLSLHLSLIDAGLSYPLQSSSLTLFGTIKKRHQDALKGQYRKVNSVIQRLTNATKVNGSRQDLPEPLQKLDDLVSSGLTYKGWKEDVAQAEYRYINNPTLLESQLKRMRKKQKITDGDRSAPELKQLDAISSGLTYKGWNLDVKAAEEYFVESYVQLFPEFLKTMQIKQAIVEGEYKRKREHSSPSTPPQLQVLLSSGITYPGMKRDVEDAKSLLVNDNLAFLSRQLVKIKEKQAVQKRENEVERWRHEATWWKSGSDQTLHPPPLVKGDHGM